VRLNTFRAANMPAAMAQLRAALGEHAVLLQTRELREGVEITGASPPADACDDEPWMIEPEPSTGPALASLPLDRPLFLVGTPGAGKTLSCVKLATREVLAGRPPLIITTDAERAGAVEQLAAFARVLGVVFAVATTRNALAKAIGRAVPGQAVLVDTAGCNPFDPSAAKALASLIHGLGNTVLVQAAGLCAEEAREEARAFLALGATLLLPTRLDVARRMAGTLAASRAGLAMTEAGTSPDPGRGLSPITPAFLAARLRGRPE
jgi:flagellar biosynthesis protein FlhF